MTVRGAFARVLALFRQRRFDQELESEVLAHLEMAERDALAAGASPEDARMIARLRFGGIAQMHEEHRERRSFQWIGFFARDLRYGLASLARDPAFTAVIIGVLALGIGANVAMFSLLDAVLLKSLPFPDPDRIVRIWEAPRPGVTNATTAPDFLDWKRLATNFETLTAEAPTSVALTGGAEPIRLEGQLVTADYFRVFGTPALIGRTFLPSEDSPGAPPVVVLSHATWQSMFGADPNILNRTAMLDGEKHQIIGVLAPGAFDRDRAQFWKPLIFTPDKLVRESHWVTVHGKLRQGVTLAQAREQMDSVHSALINVLPFWKRDWKMVVDSLDRLLIGNYLRRTILVAFGAVVLVLLIACANIANLLLAKGAARRKEMAIRTALGASRGRLMAQLLTESITLSLLGGIAGLALASVLMRAATPFLSDLIPYTASLVLDVRVFAFAAGIALATGVLVGALPSLQTSIGTLGSSLRESSRGSSSRHNRVRRVIVVSEVALSLVLVCGAVLLFRSLLKLQQIETGIRIDNVLTMSLALAPQSYPTSGNAAMFYENVAQRMKSIPGVEQAALTTHLPLRWIGNGESVQIPGFDERVNVRFKRVDARYFDAFAVPLLAGRGISEADRNGAKRVMVINQALADRLRTVAGLQDPVGRTVRVDCPPYEGKKSVLEDIEIVGVIRNETVAAPGRPHPSVVYVPLAQVPADGVNLVIRSRMDTASVMAGVRESLRQIDPNLPVGDVATMQQIREGTLAGVSRPAWLIGAFATIAALLAAIGLYGVLSQAVAQRRREMGIRMALGARSQDVIAHVMRDALALIAVGVIAGMFGALMLTRLMKSMLFEVSPLDPMALGLACASIISIGLMAAFFPASRAARVDPALTLREEG